uniref:FK506-binding protein n=1 Tax=Ixodes ricinus TaxID=34613 RepID=A0A0K8RP32_IXORI
MFWGVTLESGKRYSQVVNTSYHLSMAALEPRQSGSSSHKRVMLMLEHAKAEFLLCTLDYEKALQVPLDLSFVEGEEVTFFLNGEGTVHLTGYLTDVNGLGEPDATSEEDSSSAEEEVEDHNLTSRPVAKSKRAQNGTKKAAALKSNNSLVELVSNEIGSDDDSSDEDFEADMVEDAADDEEDEEQSDEDEEQSDEEDSDEDGEEEEEKDSEEEEEEVAVPVVPLAERKRKHTQQEAAKHSPNKSSLSNASIVTADGVSPEEGTRKKRKRNKKDSSSSLPVVQQEQSPKGKNQTVLQGGVQSQDLRVGSGPVAKPGKSVHVYYTGKLANNREFDSCRSGKAFSFKLGKGDVIKGWETGIQGMRGGGKRRLVIPPSQGYGSTRMGDIPPNSALYFDVELKAVS